MAERGRNRIPSLLVRVDQPLIGIPFEQNDREVVRYFVEEEAADDASTAASIERALALAGAWSDLDWDEMEAALYRIRHESQPTSPLEL